MAFNIVEESKNMQLCGRYLSSSSQRTFPTMLILQIYILTGDIEWFEQIYGESAIYGL
jgi:hypothetical protein